MTSLGHLEQEQALCDTHEDFKSNSILFLISLGLVTAYFILFYYFPIQYIEGMAEDYWLEWAEVFMFGITTLICVFFLLRTNDKSIRRNYCVVLLGLGAFLLAMEEISWGQRLLNIKTPEAWTRINLQGELNVHNVLMGAKDKHPRLESTVISLIIFTYGLLLPMAYTFFRKARELVKKFHFLIPPLGTIPIFLLSIAIYINIPGFFQDDEGAEFFFGIGLAFTAIYAFHKEKGYDKEGVQNKSINLLSFALPYVVTLSIILLFTVALLRIYDFRGPRSSWYSHYRLYGIDVYERIGLYHNSNKILLIAAEDKNVPTDVLHTLGKNYIRLGNKEKGNFYFQLALERDKKALSKNPNNAYLHSSIGLTYSAMGEKKAADQYSHKAIVLAKKQMKTSKEDAEVFSALGLAYFALGERKQALYWVRKAIEYGRVREMYPHLWKLQ